MAMGMSCRGRAALAGEDSTPASVLPSLHDQDREVLLLVMRDMAMREDAWTFGNRDGHQILVHLRPSRLDPGPKGQLAADLSDLVAAEVGVLLEDMRARTTCEGPLPDLSSPDLDLQLVDLDKLVSWPGFGLEDYPDAKCFVRTWLPGYSSDGTTALVRLAFGPTPHGASATYLLRRGGSQWRIDWSHLTYYA